jgi:hypothetical protein
MATKSKKPATKSTTKKKTLKKKSEGVAAPGPKTQCCAGGIGLMRR